MSPTLRLLGLPDEARVVVLHADDVGMCRGANRAFLELARAGRLDCGSVMVPCPWFPEITREAVAVPALDLRVPSDHAEGAYAALVTPALAGITYVALHPNGVEDIADIQRHHPRARAHWRTDEVRLFGSLHCDAAIAAAGVRRMGMRPPRDLHRRRFAA